MALNEAVGSLELIGLALAQGRAVVFIVLELELIGRDIVPREQKAHLPLEVPLECGAVLLRAARDHANGHRARGERDDATVERAVNDHGLALCDARQRLLEDILEVRKVFAHGDLDIDRGEGVELGAVDHVRDSAVAQHDNVVVAVVDLGRANADLHDGSGVGAHGDGVAHAELALKDDEEAREQVGDEVLRTEADGQGEESRA